MEIEKDPVVDPPREMKKENEKVKEKKQVAIPFSQRLGQLREDEKFANFLEMFKKVHINIPLVEALQGMPQYFKFLKEAVSGKWKVKELEVVHLAKLCSVGIERRLPPKITDPGSFTIPCVIGKGKINKALCDLGASINLMPYLLFKRLKVGRMSPTSILIQMADRSAYSPMGVVEDVLVKVNEFIFPVDFVVLEMKEDEEVPIKLGRPFLATAKAEIKLATRELEQCMNEDKIRFCMGEAQARGGSSFKQAEGIGVGEKLWSRIKREGCACRDPP